MISSYRVEMIAVELFKYGFWFTYYKMRTDCEYQCSRSKALWVIFVAHMYSKRLDFVKDWYIA